MNDSADWMTLAEAAQELGMTERKLLLLAENYELYLLADFDPFSAELRALPSCEENRSARRERRLSEIDSLNASYAGEIARRGLANVQSIPIEEDDEGPLASHYWWLDQPQRIGVDRVRISRAEIERYKREHGIGRPMQTAEKPDVRLKANQRHKERCRAVASVLWAQDLRITITEMIGRDEITAVACEHHHYESETLREWIKDLCPDRSPGRRPKT